MMRQTFRLRKAGVFSLNFTRQSSNGRMLSQRMPSFMNLEDKNVTDTLPMTRHRSAKTAQEAVNNILYNYESNINETEERHILSVFVDNETGVLSKVSGLLSSRGFNIDSLSVSRTDVKALSRMTIVLNGNHTQMEQAKRQLEDLCDVWAVFDYVSHETLLQRELCLIKCSALPPEIEKRLQTNDDPLTYEETMAVHFHRQAVIDIAKKFGASVADIGSETIVLELVSWPRRVEAFMKMLKPFKIVEAARSGMIAMNRGKVNDPEEEEEDRIVEEDIVINIADLPPS